MPHPDLPLFKKKFENDFAIFHLNELTDTLIVEYKESINIDSVIAEKTLTAIKPYKDAGSRYSIIDFSAQFITMTNGAKKYFKENVKPQKTRLVGVITKDFQSKTLANIYARFDKPFVQTRVFTSIKEADQWIIDNKL